MLGHATFASRKSLATGVVVAALAAVAGAVYFEMTLDDFHVPGTRYGDLEVGAIETSDSCKLCHGNIDIGNDPSSTWAGSKMAQAGRNPLFFAQMALANQDVSNVGYYCMRCHVPYSIVSGSALTPDGSAMTMADQDGVTCHICHAMVDPIYKPGISPEQDLPILAALDDVPEYYGNAMFVLDPTGTRRGTLRPDSQALHDVIASPFHATGSMCGTCHDVGNVAITAQPDGTFRYNALDEPSPTEDPHQMFPLERTYTEWALSEFADGGVDMGGRFGGVGVTTVSTCQDCHMPRAQGQMCFFGPERPDARRHEFAGSGAQTLDIIAAWTSEDPEVDQAAIAAARAAAIDMLERAATLDVAQAGALMRVRVTNESGHKLPTGHIEGRRAWVNVLFRDDAGQIIEEVGAYDDAVAELHEEGAAIFEMHVGLSDDAAAATGLPAGLSTHMALADTIVKDTRIPPRGWDNAAYAAAGSPAVGVEFEDGQYWHDSWYAIPAGAATFEARLYYQSTPKEYIEHLRDANVTNHWGQTLYDLWVQTGRGAPILMAETTASVGCLADLATPSGTLDFFDVQAFLAAFSAHQPAADFTNDGLFNFFDVQAFLQAFANGCP